MSNGTVTSEDSLTGRTRYRVAHRLFRRELVVLQVECEVRTDHFNSPAFSVTATYWRDARPEDFAFADRAPGLLMK